MRQIWVRIRALPHDSRFWSAVSEEVAAAEADKKADDVESALSTFLTMNGGRHA